MAHSRRNWGKNVAIALGVGIGAVVVTTFVAPKIPQLQAYPWLVPGLFIGGGALLAMRGRFASGIGLAGAGGAVAAIQYGPQIMGAMGGGKQASGLGWTEAGQLPRNSGWYDRPALPAAGLYGRDAQEIREAGGSWANAGALGGAMAPNIIETQGIDDDEF